MKTDVYSALIDAIAAARECDMTQDDVHQTLEILYGGQEK